MKLRGSCAALASALSAKYATYHEFQPSSGDLNTYLNDNGVVVSMCITTKFFSPFQTKCSFRKRDKIFSASWIQQNQTGFRVFQFPQPLFPLYVGAVGMVVDPTAVKVQCLYPFHGMTAARDDLVVDGVTTKACGPVFNDPRYGSEGFDQLPHWEQILIREGWNAYAQHFFQNDRNVSCSEFFGQREDDPIFKNTQLYVREKNESKDCPALSKDFTYRNAVENLVYETEYKVKHKLCRLNKTAPPEQDESNWLIYMGPCSWRPEQFNDMVQTMKNVDDMHSKVRNWNEVVMDRPTNLADSIQAVFFVERPESTDEDTDQAYRTAVKEAKKMSKHLLKVQLANDEKPLFQCNRSALELESVVLDQ